MRLWIQLHLAFSKGGPAFELLRRKLSGSGASVSTSGKDNVIGLPMLVFAAFRSNLSGLALPTWQVEQSCLQRPKLCMLRPAAGTSTSA